MSNPLAQQDRSGSAPSDSASRDPFSIPGEVKASIRVLVVDDERTLRESCASVLQMDGYNVTLVGRGVQGLRGATVGQERTLGLRTNDFSVLVRAGHRMLLTVTAGDASFYKPFPGSSAGGVLGASSLTLPVRR